MLGTCRCWSIPLVWRRASCVQFWWRQCLCILFSQVHRLLGSRPALPPGNTNRKHLIVSCIVLLQCVLPAILYTSYCSKLLLYCSILQLTADTAGGTAAAAAAAHESALQQLSRYALAASVPHIRSLPHENCTYVHACRWHASDRHCDRLCAAHVLHVNCTSADSLYCI